MTLVRFPHSDTLGSQFVCQLPEAFRRLQRPSSALNAKASTVRSYKHTKTKDAHAHYAVLTQPTTPVSDAYVLIPAGSHPLSDSKRGPKSASTCRGDCCLTPQQCVLFLMFHPRAPRPGPASPLQRCVTFLCVMRKKKRTMCFSLERR